MSLALGRKAHYLCVSVPKFDILIRVKKKHLFFFNKMIKWHHDLG